MGLTLQVFLQIWTRWINSLSTQTLHLPASSPIDGMASIFVSIRLNLPEFCFIMVDLTTGTCKFFSMDSKDSGFRAMPYFCRISSRNFSRWRSSFSRRFRRSSWYWRMASSLKNKSTVSLESSAEVYSRYSGFHCYYQTRGSTIRITLFSGSCRQPNQDKGLVELTQSCGTHGQ